MSSLKPVIHGRDHLPGGADPIPVVVTTPTATSAEEHLYVESITITSPSSVNLTWLRYDGQLLVDYVTYPTQPRIFTNGVYAVTASFRWEAGLAAGDTLEAHIGLVQGTPGYPPGGPQFTQSGNVSGASASLGSYEQMISITGKMYAGDSILVTAGNLSGGDRDVEATISVCKIVEF